MLCTVLEAVSSTQDRWKCTPMQHSHSQYSSQGPCVLPAPVHPLQNLRQPRLLYLPQGQDGGGDMGLCVHRVLPVFPSLLWPTCHQLQGTDPSNGSVPCSGALKGARRRQTHKGLTFYSYLIAIFSRSLLKLQIKLSFKQIFVPKLEEGKGEKK